MRRSKFSNEEEGPDTDSSSTERREFESRPSSQYCNKVTVRFSSVGRIWLHMLRITCSIPAAYTTRPRQSCNPGSTVWDKDMAMEWSEDSSLVIHQVELDSF